MNMDMNMPLLSIRRRKRNGGYVDIYFLYPWEVVIQWGRLEHALRNGMPDTVGIPLSRRSAFLQFGLEARRTLPNAFPEPSHAEWPGIIPLMEKFVSKPLMITLEDQTILGKWDPQQQQQQQMRRPWTIVKGFVDENEGMNLHTIGRSPYVEWQRLELMDRMPIVKWMVFTDEGRGIILALMKGSSKDLRESLVRLTDRICNAFVAEATDADTDLIPMKHKTGIDKKSLEGFQKFMYSLATLVHPPEGPPTAFILPEEERTRQRERKEMDTHALDTLRNHYTHFREFRAVFELSSSMQLYKERTKFLASSINELPGDQSVVILPPSLYSGIMKEWNNADFESTLPLAEVPPINSGRAILYGGVVCSSALVVSSLCRRYRLFRYPVVGATLVSGMAVYNTWTNYKNVCMNVRSNMTRAAMNK